MNSEDHVTLNQNENNIKDEFGIDPKSGEENMILDELKEEDRKLEKEKNLIRQYEDATYEIKFTSKIESPTQNGDDKNDCFTVRFDKLDNQIAAGYINGCISVFNLDDGKSKDMKASSYPVTCIRWKPYADSRPKNILVSVTADGRITHWHTASGKALHSMQETDNAIMCLDYNSEGNLFATAGNDKLVRLYDDNTKTLLNVMRPGSFSQPGHSNRIFCLNFHKENYNLLASGGWDNTIQFYDLRQGTVFNSLYGPHICGDSIDMKGDYLLTGSWSVKDQLQLWDLRTFKVVQNIPWENKSLFFPTYVYTAQFSKKCNSKTNLFGVGGSNNPLIRVFENDTKEKLPQATSDNLSSSCYSLDFSNSGKLLAFGCGDGAIRILSTKKINTFE